MTDEDWVAFNHSERRFALRWIAMSEDERDEFSRQLLAAIEVLERFRVFEAPEPTPGDAAAG
jgi:hypothetical protein